MEVIFDDKDGKVRLIIEIDLDAHDDIYYRVLENAHILADRIYGYDNLMLFLGAKIRSAFGRRA